MILIALCYNCRCSLPRLVDPSLRSSVSFALCPLRSPQLPQPNITQHPPFLFDPLLLLIKLLPPSNRKPRQHLTQFPRWANHAGPEPSQWWRHNGLQPFHPQLLGRKIRLRRVSAGVNIPRAHRVRAEGWGVFLEGEEGSLSAPFGEAVVGS